jgi:hypothetical protein
MCLPLVLLLWLPLVLLLWRLQLGLSLLWLPLWQRSLYQVGFLKQFELWLFLLHFLPDLSVRVGFLKRLLPPQRLPLFPQRGLSSPCAQRQAY